MKKIIIGIIIGITLSLGTVTFASSVIKLVMIPEYIGGYKTTDLLEYVAKQKAKEEYVQPIQSIHPQIITPIINPTFPKVKNNVHSA